MRFFFLDCIDHRNLYSEASLVFIEITEILKMLVFTIARQTAQTSSWAREEKYYNTDTTTL